MSDKPWKVRGFQTQQQFERAARFVEAYLVHFNSTQAVKQAGYQIKSDKVAGVRGATLLADARVQALIADRQKEMALRTEITPEKVLEKWWAIANADANELSQHRRNCCRHCWGDGHEFQWRDGREFAAAQSFAAASKAAKERMREDPDWDIDFDKVVGADDAGGFGFRSNRKPHPECPECEGEGIANVFFADTRDLSPSAKLLYRGVKRTRDGLEILTANQDKALENVARHLGMFNGEGPAVVVNHTEINQTNVSVDITVEQAMSELEEIFGDAIPRAPAIGKSGGH